MRRKSVWLLSWVLVSMMLLTCVAQAESSVPKTSTPPLRITAPSRSTLESPPGGLSANPSIQVIKKGKGVTYRFTKPIKYVGNKIATTAPTKKAALSSISLLVDSQMGLNTDYNIFSRFQPIWVRIKPANATWSLKELKSSNLAVISFAEDEDGYLHLVANKTGSATITLVTNNGKKASKKITVKNIVPFSSMSIGYMKDPETSVTLKSKTVYAGDSFKVLAQPKPRTATYYDYPYWWYYDYETTAVKFSSSNESVATAMEGYVFAHKPGTATIYATARDGSKKKGSFKLTVKAKNPEGIYLSDNTLNLAPSATYRLGYGIDPYSYYDQKVTWSSSNTKVATVSATGLVTAVSRGTAIITVKTNTGKKTDTCTVNVSYSKAANDIKYRFYGIGNANYTSAGKLPSCLNDLNIMAAAANDAGFNNVYKYPDCTADGIYDVLSDMTNNDSIDDNDVTVFYYSGHGLLSNVKAERGALCGVDGDYVPVDMVQLYLECTRGTVVVILDSCLSGQFITSKSLSPAQMKAQLAAFNSAWTSAISSSKTAYTSKALTSSTERSRFKILTAAAPLESSYGSGLNTGFGWFTSWAANGLGRIANSNTGSSTSGPLAADTNADSAVTLTELYNYIKTNLSKQWDPIFQQNVQVWPSGDKTAIVNKVA
jgi:uncharacterized protein YjdB